MSLTHDIGPKTHHWAIPDRSRGMRYPHHETAGRAD